MIKSELNGWRIYCHDAKSLEEGYFYFSVTAILEVIEHKKLSEWKIKNSKNAVAKRKKESANLGSRIHSVVEQSLNNQQLKEEDQDLKEFYDRFKGFQEKNQIKTHATEEVVFSERYGYAGQFDGLIDWKGHKCVSDLKTGRSYPIKTGWQLAAYKYAYEEMTGESGIGMVGFHQPQDQPNKDPVPFQYRHYESCYLAFLSALNCFRMLYFNELKKLGWKYVLKNPLEAYYGC